MLITGKVTFEYSTKEGSFVEEQEYLDFVKIWDSNNNLLKKMKLDYKEIASDPKYPHQLTNYPYPNNTDHSSRIFLSQVTEISKKGTAKKSYQLSYYNPEDLPFRFSYAQDYWGYFNGKIDNQGLISKDVHTYDETNYEYGYLNKDDFNDLFDNGLGADRTADGAFGIKGILKKITYPTGGYTEFLYESHAYFGDDFIPSERTSLVMSTESPEDNFDPAKKVLSEEQADIQFNHKAYLYGGAYQECEEDEEPWDNNPPDPQDENQNDVEELGDAELRVKNLTTGQYVDIFRVEGENDIVNKGEFILLSADYKHFVNLEENNKYKLELTILTECTDANASLRYQTKASATAAVSYMGFNKKIVIQFE